MLGRSKRKQQDKDDTKQSETELVVGRTEESHHLSFVPCGHCDYHITLTCHLCKKTMVGKFGHAVQCHPKCDNKAMVALQYNCSLLQDESPNYHTFMKANNPDEATVEISIVGCRGKEHMELIKKIQSVNLLQCLKPLRLSLAEFYESCNRFVADIERYRPHSSDTKEIYLSRVREVDGVEGESEAEDDQSFLDEVDKTFGMIERLKIAEHSAKENNKNEDA